MMESEISDSKFYCHETTGIRPSSLLFWLYCKKPRQVRGEEYQQIGKNMLRPTGHRSGLS